MLKVNKAIVIILIVSAFILTGCGNQIPEMTEDEYALVTEYAAGVLLQYHGDYQGRLVDTSVEIEKEAVAQKEETTEILQTEEKSDMESEDDLTADDSTQKEEAEISGAEVEKPTMSIAQVLEMSDCEMTYQSFAICDSYPETELSAEELAFVMKAGPGNKLLVLNLQVKNVTGQEVQFNTLEMLDLKCKMHINENKVQNAYVSMLENDFMAMNRTLAPGESLQAVVITEMSEEEAAQVTTVDFEVQKGKLSTIVKLQQ